MIFPLQHRVPPLRHAPADAENNIESQGSFSDRPARQERAERRKGFV